MSIQPIQPTDGTVYAPNAHSKKTSSVKALVTPLLNLTFTDDEKSKYKIKIRPTIERAVAFEEEIERVKTKHLSTPA